MSGLVGHWPLHEWSGRANDLSGNELNQVERTGTIQGVAGKAGLTANSFDGSDDYIQFDALSSLPSYTMSVWIRPDDVSTRSVPMALRANNDTRFEINSDGTVEVLHNDGSAQIVSTSIESQTWTHLCATWDGNNVSLYKDSEFIGQTSAGSMGSPSGGTRVGSYSDNQLFYSGTVFDARVYDRALSPQEVQTLYEQGSEDYTDPTLHDGSDSGAVSRYTFDGDVTADSWGTNDLTDNTSAGTTSDAVYGTAKSFDGSDDYMEIGDIADGIGEITISIWVRSNTSGANQEVVAKGTGGTSSTDSSWDLQLGGADHWNWYIYDSNGDYRNITGVEPALIGEWQNIVGVYDGTYMKVYINGVLRGEKNVGSVTIQDTATTAQIGRRSDGANYFSGDMDDVRIYSRALSASEVAQLYRQGHGRDLRPKVVQE